MHLKEAYQRRIAEQSIEKKPMVNHSQVIGSTHTGKINFEKGVSFFSDFKPRENVLLAKRQSLDFKDANILQLKSARWNQSVAAPNRFDGFQKEESHKSKLLKIKLGLTDWEPVSPKLRKSFVGTETRNDYTGWNVSTFVEKKQKEEGILKTNLNALDNTLSFSNTKLTNYKRLSDRYEETKEIQKSIINENKDIIEDLKKSYLYSHPNASPTQSNAASLRLYDEVRREKLKRSLYSTDTNDSRSTFKAKLSPTQKMNINVKYFHSGNWGKNSPTKGKVADSSDSEQEDDYAWSCCLNSDHDSNGCCHRIVDKNKMNLESFNL